MNREAKLQVQGSFFNLLIPMDPSVGDVVEIGLGLAYNALIQYHQGDPGLAAASMREAVDQCLTQASQIITPASPSVISKLDS